jgi:hypothetical protein
MAVDRHFERAARDELARRDRLVRSHEARENAAGALARRPQPGDHDRGPGRLLSALELGR